MLHQFADKAGQGFSVIALQHRLAIRVRYVARQSFDKRHMGTYQIGQWNGGMTDEAVQGFGSSVNAVDQVHEVFGRSVLFGQGLTQTINAGGLSRSA